MVSYDFHPTFRNVTSAYLGMCQKWNSEFILRLYRNPVPTVKVVQLKDMRK